MQEPQLPPSIRHSKLAEASPVNPNEAEVDETNPEGPDVIDGAEGATVSAVQVLLEAEEVFPA